MTTGQRLQLRLSEIRQTLNELSGLDSPTDEQRATMATLSTEYPTIETRWRAATIAEADAPETRADDGEDTERRALVERVELRQYLHAAANGVPVAGAEAELNAALDVRGAGGVGRCRGRRCCPVTTRNTARTRRPRSARRITV